MKRLSPVSIAALVLVGATMVLAPASAQEPDDATAHPHVTSTSAILVNLSDGGTILYERDARTPRSPASLTKVVTALVVRDQYSMDEVVTVDPIVERAWGSSLGIKPGMTFTVRDLLAGFMMKSGNDAGIALASHHPLGYRAFVQLMNEKARSLGAYDSHFRNPHGLDEIGHRSSARDMAIFARELLSDPVLADMVQARKTHISWPDGTVRELNSQNRLLLNDPAVIGIKTGFTRQAGHCLISAANTEAGTLVTVVLNSQDHYGDTTRMWDYGRALSGQAASGGGTVSALGRLPGPPAAPDETLALPAVLEAAGVDPRDDRRWPLLMLALTALTAGTLVWSRRAKTVTGADEVDVWLASLVENERSQV